jgi:stage V sporulation protein B
LNFAYGPEVAERGASTLRVLAIGQGAFTLFGIASTVLASLGRERIAAVLSLVALCAVAAFVTLAASDAPYGLPQLRATALATTTALGLALAAATFVVRRSAGGFVPLATFVRAAIGVALGAFLGTSLPIFGKLVTPFVSLGIGVAYLGYLVLTRELTGADAAMVRTLVGRKAT